MWTNPPMVQPISPAWLGVLAVAVVALVLAIAGQVGLFAPLCSAVKRLAVAFRPRHLLLLPLAAALVVFGSTKPPPVVVQRGIKLTKCVQTSSRIYFEWVADDDRIAPGATYFVQEMLDGRWVTVAETVECKFELVGFTIDRSRRYRIVTTVPEGGEDDE